MKKFLMAATAALAVSLGAASAEAATKACWVYIGPFGDFGWSYQHHQGALAVKKEFGDKVEIVEVENVPEAELGTFNRTPRPRRLQHHFHNIIRLHGANAQGSQEIPRCEV